MKPPLCQVCKRDFRSEPLMGKGNGGTVRFADYEALPEGMVGHPKGMEWFCAEHIEAAKALSKLNYAEAIKQLREGT